MRLRIDHGKVFKDSKEAEFYKDHGIAHEFSTPITFQQNSVAKMKNHDTGKENIKEVLG